MVGRKKIKKTKKASNKFRVCQRCRFRIPENEWNMWKECGQCGSKKYKWVYY